MLEPLLGEKPREFNANQSAHQARGGLLAVWFRRNAIWFKSFGDGRLDAAAADGALLTGC